MNHQGKNLALDQGMLHFCSEAQTQIYSPQSNGMKPALIVFAKAPIPGRVKTRLGLDPDHAVEIHRELVWTTLLEAWSFREKADLELALDQPTDCWTDLPIRRTLQSAGDLGSRIYAALDHALSRGCPIAVVLGSDSPQLPHSAIEFLLHCPADVALGPTEDGGYYGIGCRKTAPHMFDGVQWSAATTLRDTMHALERCALSCALGPHWFDVDRPEDLERWRGLAP